MALFAVSINLITNILRGDYTPLDIQRCGLYDWSIFAAFILTMLLMSFMGLQINKRE